MADEIPDDHESHEGHDHPHVIGVPLSALFGRSQEQQDAIEMEATTEKHAIYDFLHRQKKDDLHTLDVLINIVGGRAEAATYYAGYISSVLSLKYNICPSCRENHDEKLGDIVSPKDS